MTWRNAGMHGPRPISVVICVLISFPFGAMAEPPAASQPAKIVWGPFKRVGVSASPQSRLSELRPEDYKKSADLDVPVIVTVLSVGRVVKGLEEIQDRIVDVRVTNPNPYAIFFQGRQYRDNKTIKPGWGTRKDGEWKIVGWDLCGTGIRDWEIEPHGSIDLMLYLHPDLKEQRIYGRFYRVDQPSTQSECLLYESL